MRIGRAHGRGGEGEADRVAMASLAVDPLALVAISIIADLHDGVGRLRVMHGGDRDQDGQQQA
jgi:hypothetical protein